MDCRADERVEAAVRTHAAAHAAAAGLEDRDNFAPVPKWR